MTGLDIVTRSLREIGVLAAGETATADDALDGLAALNSLLDQWAAERLLIHILARTTWTISSGTGTYYVGTGQTINRARPAYVDHVNLLETSTDPDQERPLSKLLDDGWAGIAQKDMESTDPTHWYYKHTYPYGTIELWPVPTSATLNGVMYAPQAIARFTSLSDSFDLPPGYERMIVKNLAVELAPSYERQPDQMLIRQAMNAHAVVKSSNIRPLEMSFDPGVLGASCRGAYDIMSDR